MSEQERFVPQRVGPLTTELCRLPWVDDEDGARFRAFVHLASALYHYEFYGREQALIEAWERIGQEGKAAGAVTQELTGLLDAANYTTVTMAELDDALSRESLIPLRLEVDLDDYEELLIYRRGSRSERVDVPKWRGLRTEERTMTVDERVVIHSRIKPQQWFDDHKIDPTDRNLVPDHVSLKQFQNVPRADIEMLLPSAKVRFRAIDTLMVGVPALVSGIAVLTTKLLPTVGLIFILVAASLGLRDEQPALDQTSLVILLGGAITLGGFVFRQWSKLKSRRLAYLKTLSENLYFRTLGDGPGVLHTLLASAEQQEIVEVILAYRFLLAAPEGLTTEALDAAVEDWLRGACRRDVDFEIDDAVDKLRRLEVVDGETTLRALPLPDALWRLDRRWDDLFQHRRTGLPAADNAREDGSDHGATVGSGRTPSLLHLRRVVDHFGGHLGDRLLRREDAIGDGPAGG